MPRDPDWTEGCLLATYRLSPRCRPIAPRAERGAAVMSLTRSIPADAVGVCLSYRLGTRPVVIDGLIAPWSACARLPWRVRSDTFPPAFGESANAEPPPAPTINTVLSVSGSISPLGQARPRPPSVAQRRRRHRAQGEPSPAAHPLTATPAYVPAEPSGAISSARTRRRQPRTPDALRPASTTRRYRRRALSGTSPARFQSGGQGMVRGRPGVSQLEQNLSPPGSGTGHLSDRRSSPYSLTVIARKSGLLPSTRSMNDGSCSNVSRRVSGLPARQIKKTCCDSSVILSQRRISGWDRSMIVG
jgi:hypothetical protein